MPYNACGRADIDAHPRYDRAPHRLKVHHPFYHHPVKKIGLDSLQTPPQQGAQVCLYFLIGLIDGYLKVYNCLYDIGELAILSNTTSEFAAQGLGHPQEGIAANATDTIQGKGRCGLRPKTSGIIAVSVCHDAPVYDSDGNLSI